MAVRSAAEDTDRVRALLWRSGGNPKSPCCMANPGAGVAARTAEIFNIPINNKLPYDAVLLTSGVLGGGSQSYNFRLDLRVVYQAVCNNHPKPDEPAYPLWQGLPVNNC